MACYRILEILKDHKEGDVIDIASMHKRLDEADSLRKRRIYDVFIVFAALGLVGGGPTVSV